MNNIEFNLTKEPWIRVALKDGEVVERSFVEVLENAHEYLGLAGEMAAQDIAILRCLIAIVHTVFTRVDLYGEESAVSQEEECIERWKELWENKKFPCKPIVDYFEKWNDRFWLFHPERPFYQVAGAHGTKNNVSKLNGAVSESNNKVRLFSQLSGIGKEAMTFAESARWLLFLNGFDDCAAKQVDKSDGSRSVTVSWLGKLGLIYNIGDNLFETIMLNMPMIHGKDEVPWEADIPTWELENVRKMERQTIKMPDNLAGLYTLQSRRIFLTREGDSVTGYDLLGGDAFEDMNALGEPMTIWKVYEKEKSGVLSYKPYLHMRKRFIWRDFSVITAASESYFKPGIISWSERLGREKILSRNRMVKLGIVCVRYDSSQSSSITDNFSDEMTFNADLLSEVGRYWRKDICEQIENIDKSAYYLGELVEELKKANGTYSEKNKATIRDVQDAAKLEMYYEVDRAFREWLVKINADQDAEERAALELELENEVKRIALKAAQEQVDQSGEGAYIGRTVEKNKKKEFYSAPKAFNRFKKRIYDLYPNVKGDDAGE